MSDESQNIEAVVTAPASGDTAAPEPVDTGAPGEETPPEPKTFTQEELDKILGAEKAKVERRIRREMQQAAEAAQRHAPVAPPQAEDFQTVEAFVDAMADFKAEQKVNQREQQKYRSEVETTYAEREDSAREKYSDFEIAYRQPHEGGPAISDYMAEVIKASELGPEVLYHLAKNQRESVRIFGLSPLQQAKELGRIEAALQSSPTARKVSNAPEPIRPVGSRSSTPSFDVTDPRSDKSMSTDAWIKARNQQEAKRHAR